MTEKQCSRPRKLPGMVYLLELTGGVSPLYANEIKSSHETLCRELLLLLFAITVQFQKEDGVQIHKNYNHTVQ